jgi:hypothetical protein
MNCLQIRYTLLQAHAKMRTRSVKDVQALGAGHGIVRTR